MSAQSRQTEPHSPSDIELGQSFSAGHGPESIALSKPDKSDGGEYYRIVEQAANTLEGVRADPESSDARRRKQELLEQNRAHVRREISDLKRAIERQSNTVSAFVETRHGTREEVSLLATALQSDRDRLERAERKLEELNQAVQNNDEVSLAVAQALEKQGLTGAGLEEFSARLRKAVADEVRQRETVSSIETSLAEHEQWLGPAEAKMAELQAAGKQLADTLTTEIYDPAAMVVRPEPPVRSKPGLFGLARKWGNRFDKLLNRGVVKDVSLDEHIRQSQDRIRRPESIQRLTGDYKQFKDLKSALINSKDLRPPVKFDLSAQRHELEQDQGHDFNGSKARLLARINNLEQRQNEVASNSQQLRAYIEQQINYAEEALGLDNDLPPAREPLDPVLADLERQYRNLVAELSRKEQLLKRPEQQQNASVLRKEVRRLKGSDGEDGEEREEGEIAKIVRARRARLESRRYEPAVLARTQDEQARAVLVAAQKKHEHEDFEFKGRVKAKASSKDQTRRENYAYERGLDAKIAAIGQEIIERNKILSYMIAEANRLEMSLKSDPSQQELVQLAQTLAELKKHWVKLPDLIRQFKVYRSLQGEYGRARDLSDDQTLSQLVAAAEQRLEAEKAWNVKAGQAFSKRFERYENKKAEKQAGGKLRTKPAVSGEGLVRENS